MLTILTWRWGNKYDPSYVTKLVAGLRRNMQQPFRFACVTDNMAVGWPGVETWPLMDIELAGRGCLCRLRMFDPAWQAENGLKDNFVCIDLDVVITGPLDDLFNRTESFVILQGANTSNPCPYNGSLMMLQPGAYSGVWANFSPERAGRARYHEFPDDQGWLATMLPDAAGWKVGPSSGVWAFGKRHWPGGDALPAGARIVCFPGWRDPCKFDLPWIREHWQ